ncbi:MAG TPA: glycosyltransferase family 4 protein [Leptolyngbyaceae cyanobacterium M33_DOE_097]|uniref:Glycosyltransferase n=1 Tax=Oscillatoriales cyanobacterium SpSt-418 TaxID=2282169 RepID=A0A7C3KG88_9CYAN|nr:glycosyltransferase family 4 protein [Leptolyngbyaceae cyanobacterium M33_DOE_097]
MRPLRIIYEAGCGNVMETYKQWASGIDDPIQVSVAYSAQFYEVCKELGAEAYVISYNHRYGTLKQGAFTIEHRKIPYQKASALLYYLGRLIYGLRFIGSAIRHRADVAVVSTAVPWFIYRWLRFFGIQIVPTLHCVLWLKYEPQKKIHKTLLHLGRDLFIKDCIASLAVSEEIRQQVIELTNHHNRPVLRCFPYYRRSQFEGVEVMDSARSPFRILYVGRIETNKGVYDLLEIAKRFANAGIDDVRIDLCGNGTELEALRKAAIAAGVDSFFVCHGHCNKAQMRDFFRQSHVVTAPTRSDFVEGFNKVVVEGLLAGRPVVASTVCNDLPIMEAGVIAIEPNDVDGYYNAFLKLKNDPEFFAQKRQGSLELREKFLDSSHSWGANLKSLLIPLMKEKGLI